MEEEESRTVGPIQAWCILIVLSLLLVGWGLLNYALIHERTREWDFGQLPDTPAESVYSTQQSPQPASAPQQVPRLPGVTTTLPASTSAEGQP